jgi:hypothetical protein
MTSIPPAFRPFAQYWRLTEPQMRHFWNAVSRSQYSQPTAWRQQVLLFLGRGMDGAQHLVHTISTPQVMMEVLEALIHEQRLSAQEGHDIEEALLRATDREGCWKNERRQDDHPGELSCLRTC